jgi:hypothetical protein
MMPEEDQAVPASPVVPSESQFRRGLRRTIRWGAGLLLIFALGLMTATLAFYMPKVRELTRVESLRGEANERIAALEAELESMGVQLEAFEQDQETQQAALDAANLHIFILAALADTSQARLALALEKPEDARLALTNTSDTLESLTALVDSDQTEALQAMQQRLDLALSGLDSDPEAALSDLEVLANNLVKLENTYFVVP